MQPTSEPRLWAQSQRVVGADVTAVRAAMLRVIRELDFEVDGEQFATVRASRGSQLGGATLSPARIPLSLNISLEPAGPRTTVLVRLEDRWRAPVGRPAGATAAYQRAFDGALGSIDAALGLLDPAAVAGFAPRTQAPAFAGSSAAAVDRFGALEAKFKRKTSRLLDGKVAPGPAGELGRGRAGSDPAGGFDLAKAQVAISSPEKVARLDLGTVYVMLTAGQLIAARPGKLPPAMTAQVRELVIEFERRLDTSSPPPFVQLQVSTAQVPVVSFLHQQTLLRDQLPLRTLQVCDTCRLEKIINPDFIQMRERSRRMKVLTGSFGVVGAAHHISPYVLVGRLVQLKKSDPDFVCQRCQGLDADETIITFCPRCGERCADSVLRECRRCKLDFRKLLTPATIWHDITDVGWPPAAGPALDEGGQWAPPPVLEGGQWAPPPVLEGGQWAPPPVDAGQWSAPASSLYAGANQAAQPYPAQPYPAQPYVAEPYVAAAVAAVPAADSRSDINAGWFADYSGRHEYRYWDGQAWTTSVSDAGVVSTDAI